MIAVASDATETPRAGQIMNAAREIPVTRISSRGASAVSTPPVRPARATALARRSTALAHTGRAPMAPLVVTPAVATRWASSETDGRARWFEVVVTLPGVRSGADVHADVVHVHADRSVLSVLASATTPGAGTAEGDPGVDYRADAPLPRECDTADGARVKFSKRSSTLTARFPERAAPAPPPQSRESISAETSDPRGGGDGDGGDGDGGGGGGGDDDGDVDGLRRPPAGNNLSRSTSRCRRPRDARTLEDAAVETARRRGLRAAAGAAASPKTSPEETLGPPNIVRRRLLRNPKPFETGVLRSRPARRRLAARRRPASRASARFARLGRRGPPRRWPTI